jgi:hypothetical protein
MVMNAGKMFAGFAYILQNRMIACNCSFLMLSICQVRGFLPSNMLYQLRHRRAVAMHRRYPTISLCACLFLLSDIRPPSRSVLLICLQCDARFIFAAVHLLHNGLPPDSPATFRRNALAASAQVISRATACSCLRRVILATNR